MNLNYFYFKSDGEVFYCIYKNENISQKSDLNKASICYLGVGKENFDRFSSKLKKKFGLPDIKYKNNSLISSSVIDYLSGKQRNIDINTFFPTGTEFEKKVWEIAKEIPYGSKISYKALSEKVCFHIGKPKSYRAVGNALGKNPVILLVPCHRIIKSNGDIGNFSSGISLKKKLLDLEAKNSINP
ncbi:MAG: methylated-DNA--[protein]-cysteine S-methyltransferase [Actinomycetota bacterium]|nr:methylated-DNA--[protein]-cysteine S-methyltransferase [Actinomycetota bacterium]